MYIKDLQTGHVRKYGSDRHDSLRISDDGRVLSYYNLQNGDGSQWGDYRFCDDEGHTPEEDETLAKYGADAYFNIGGWEEEKTVTWMLSRELNVAVCSGCKAVFITTGQNDAGEVLIFGQAYKLCPMCGGRIRRPEKAGETQEHAKNKNINTEEE